ncbi:MAG: oligosaccharide flippase family protein, partial [Fidelibacterota bacterium]
MQENGKVRTLFKQSLVYGTGLLARSVVILLLPLYTNVLPPDQFGILTLILTFIGIVAVFYVYGLNMAFLRFYVLEKNAHGKRVIFSSSFLGIFGVSLSLSIIIILLAKPLSLLILSSTDLHRFFYFSAAILFLDSMAVVPLVYLQAEGKSVKFILLTATSTLCNLILNFVFILKLRMGVEGVLWSYTISSLLVLVLTIPIYSINLRPLFDRVIYSQLFKYGIPYVFNITSIVLMDLIDRFFLGKMVSLEAVALYNVGYKIGALMAILVNAFRLAWQPFSLRVSEREDAKVIYSRVFSYFLVFSSGVFLFIAFFIKDISGLGKGKFSIIGAEYQS